MENNNRTWEALSMKDRASFIKLAVQNGYKDIGSIRSLYNNYQDGGPIKEEYDYSDPGFQAEMAAFIDRIKQKALEISRTRELPKDTGIIEKYSDEDIRHAQNWADDRLFYRNQALEKIADFYPWLLTNSYRPSRLPSNQLEAYTDLKLYDRSYRQRQDVVDSMREGGTPGATCIATGTDDYNIAAKGELGPERESSVVTGNYTFRDNPSKYGFREKPIRQVSPGDIVQNNKNSPTHAMIFDSYDKDGTPLFNYSDGGVDAESMRYKVPYFNKISLTPEEEFNKAAAFEFVGTPQDSLLVARRYFNKALGGPLYNQNNPIESFQGNPYIPVVRYKDGGSIYIKPSKKGTFTAAAKKRHMGVQEFASKVLVNKEDYSPAMVKKANFARNAKKFKH